MTQLVKDTTAKEEDLHEQVRMLLQQLQGDLKAPEILKVQLSSLAASLQSKVMLPVPLGF